MRADRSYETDWTRLAQSDLFSETARVVALGDAHDPNLISNMGEIRPEG